MTGESIAKKARTFGTFTAECHDGKKLRRSLGRVSLTAFGVGNTIGAGIFVLTGTIAAHHAGPAVTLSYILASIVCMVAGLCYAEFATMAPDAGSAYRYAYATMGEGVAWAIGWSLMLEYLFTGALIAIGWSGYVTSALRDIGIDLPGVICTAPLGLNPKHHVRWTHAWVDLPAVLVTLACTGMALLETRLSGGVNVAIVGAKVIAIAAVICFGAAYVNPANWHPFLPVNTGVFGEFGWSGVALGAGVVFFAYLGFDGVTTLAEEATEPHRTIPFSLLASLAICTVLYVGVSVVITGLVDYRTLGVPDPIYYALQTAAPRAVWLKLVVVVGAIVGLVSAILFSILGQTRIFLAMARDGLLPPAMGRIHDRFGTPVISTVITGVVAAMTAGLAPLDILGELISIGTLMAFAVVCVGIVILRQLRPDLPRAFRTPWVPVLPLTGFFACISLMLSLPLDTWLRLAVWLCIGFAIYFGYGRRHSKKMRAHGPAGGD